MENTTLPVIPQTWAPTAERVATSIATTRPSAGVGSLYIHVPFCFHKCHYCDFYSVVDTQGRQESFVSRLETELEALSTLSTGRSLDTVFIGGGTPTLLPVAMWTRLLETLSRRFDLRSIKNGQGEFTVECNPETASLELMETLRQGGVDRISVGAQSFAPTSLKTLERWHDPENVGRALDLARAAGICRQSIDLIFAVPGQTLDEWVRDLRTAVDLGTEHLSCYALTYEPRTALTARLQRGEFRPADEDLETDMFNATVEVLRSAGLDRYEVSNFARPGAECRHNLVYWRQGEWLAAGPSASGHARGHRWKNIARLDDYLRSPPGFSPIVEHEAPDQRRALRERVMTGLRLREGIDSLETLGAAERLDPGTADRIEAVVRGQRAAGNLHVAESGRWSLTDKGFLVADAVVVEFFSALDAGGDRRHRV